MAAEAERLVVSLEARVNQFERELARANRTADTRVRGIERRFQQANQNVSSAMQRMAGQIRLIEGPLGGVAGRFTSFNQQLREVGPAAAIAIAGIAGVSIAAQRLYSYARSTVSELSALAKAADRVGLATDDFQRLQFGFQLAGVEAREFESSMEQFARRMGEAATRGGRLAEILEANGVAIRDANGQMRSSMDLLRDYAELIRRAGSDQERLVLAQEAFGRAGLDFVNALRNGEAALDDMATAADDAGGVIEERLLRKAEEFDDRWAASWRAFSVNAKSAVMEAITWLDNFMSKSDQVGNHPIFRRLAEILPSFGGADLTYLDPDLARARGQPLGPDARIRDDFGGELQAADQALVDALKQRYGVVTEEAATTIIPDGSKERAGGRAGSRNRAAEAALREAEAVAKLIENLEHELSTIGLTDVERQKANALRQAGAAATDEQRAKIEQLIEAIHREKEAMEAAAEASEFFRKVTEDAFMSLIPAINTGNKALDDLLNTLIKVVAQAMLFGRGPLGGLFGGGGGLLGGIFPFAKGGIAANGRPVKTFARGGVSRTAAIFGEAGPEAAVPLPDGRRIPVDLKMPSGGESRGTEVNFSPSYNIDARGAQRGVGEEIASALEAYDKGRLARLAKDLPELRGRGALR